MTLGAMTYAFCKSVLDRTAAVVALAVLSPFLASIAAAIALVDGLPVLFTQQRTGQQGRPFRIYKFRTLRTGLHDPARPGDHLTRTGGFLRRWALRRTAAVMEYCTWGHELYRAASNSAQSDAPLRCI